MGSKTPFTTSYWTKIKNRRKRSVFFLMAILVCDAIMGSGKTSASIRYMNEHTEKKFVFVTPFLSEVERVLEQCAERKFKTPSTNGKTHSKLQDFNRLLQKGENIVSTHALFTRYNNKTKKLVKEQGYTLIMDETMNVLEPLEFKKDDIAMLLQSGIITLDEDSTSLSIGDEDYKGSFSNTLFHYIRTGKVFYWGGTAKFWSYPISIFEAFEDVILLTYMFDSSIQCYYYQTHDAPVRYIGVGRDDIGYYLSTTLSPNKSPGLIEKVHFLEHDKLNHIGERNFSLSASWYQSDKNRGGHPNIVRIKHNLYNYYHNLVKVPQSERMWTVYKSAYDLCKGKGYTRGFVQCNARATNEHREKRALAYPINVFQHPFIQNCLKQWGVEVDDDGYALSQMVQWMWRSAIRDNEEIYIYVPSKRMRTLLSNWLEEVSF